MLFALVGVAVVAAVIIGWLVQSLSGVRRELAGARTEGETVTRELLATRKERDEVTARLTEAEAQRDAATAARTTAEHRAAEAEEARKSLELTPPTGDACWPLLLADLERRWAAVVGAVPSMRGISEGSVAEQLDQGLGREVERLREEVGVDIRLSSEGSVEPTSPVVFLLAAIDLLGAMAATCERMVVELDGQLVLIGEVMADSGDELDASRQRAVDAGVDVDPLQVDEESVRVTVHP